MKEQYGVDSMPETAENVAQQFNVSRADHPATTNESIGPLACRRWEHRRVHRSAVRRCRRRRRHAASCARTSGATGSTSPSEASDFALASCRSATTRRRTSSAPAGASVGGRTPATAGAAHQLLPRELRLRRPERVASGIEPFLHHEALLDAARRLHGRPVDRAGDRLRQPHGPGPGAGGAHRRARVPRRQPQADPAVAAGRHAPLGPVRASGACRSPPASRGSTTATAAASSRTGPTAPTGAVRAHPSRAQHRASCSTPTRVFHGVDRIAAPAPSRPAALEPGMRRSSYDGDGGWVVRDGDDASSPTYDWDELRFSVSWKAYCFADEDERDAWRDPRRRPDPRRDPRPRWSTTSWTGAGRGSARADDRVLARLLVDGYMRFPAAV